MLSRRNFLRMVIASTFGDQDAREMSPKGPYPGDGSTVLFGARPLCWFTRSARAGKGSLADVSYPSHPRVPHWLVRPCNLFPHLA